MENLTRSAIGLFPESVIEGMEEFRTKHISHPGKNVPLHITLLSNFYMPKEIDKDIIDKLILIAADTAKFTFQAKPISCFPTSSVLYLTPSPTTPLETLTSKLCKAFPKFASEIECFPIFHMTIALEYQKEQQKQIIDEYIEKFGYKALEFKAGSLGIFCEYEGEWKTFKVFELGKNEYIDNI